MSSFLPMPRRMRRAPSYCVLLAPMFLCFVLTGCTEEPPGTAQKAVTGDTTRLQLEWTVGSATAPGVVLSGVTDGAVSATGTVAVLEGQTRNVALLDSAGGLLTRVGGHGSGPRELLRPIELGFVSDTLWVTDQGTNSVSFWLSRGRFLNRTSFRLSTNGTDDGRNVIDGYLAHGRYVTVDGPRSTNAFINRVDTTRSYYLTTASGEVVARLGTVNLIDSKIGIRNEGARFQGIYGDQPISDHPLFVYGGTREPAIYKVQRSVSESSARDSFSVWQYGPDGTVQRTETIAYDPVFLSPSYRDSLIALWANHAQTSKGVQTASKQQARQLAREALFLPDYFPPVRDAAVAPSGALWIELWSGPSSDRRLLFIETAGTVCEARFDSSLEMLAATERGVIVGGVSAGIPTVKYFATKSGVGC